jgi:hypothetical protein
MDMAHLVKDSPLSSQVSIVLSVVYATEGIPAQSQADYWMAL